MKIRTAALIDVHAHFRDPGYTYKEDMRSGAAAAFAGGYSTVVCMANTAPVIDSPELVRANTAAAEGLPIRVLQAAAATVNLKGERLTDFAALKLAGASAISDDGNAILDASVMFDALVLAREVALPIMTHSEDSRFRERGAVAEEYMVARDLTLARYANAPLHIQHVTTARAVAMIREAKRDGVRVTCETCPHYFTFTEDLRERVGAIAKVFPPLRTRLDVDAVIEGLADGTIDIIATDHAPHSREEKLQPWSAAPGGMLGLETAFSAAITALYHSGALTLPQLLEKFVSNPAKLLNIEVPEVFIELDTDAERTLAETDLHSKSANSPYIGVTLKGNIERVT